VPRAGLNRDVLAAEAARLADEVGYDGLTLAALAGRFGVAVPSLYKHVEGLGAVRRDLKVLAIQELGKALAAAIERDGLDAMAEAYRRFAASHPGLYAATVRAADPADAEANAASRAALGTVLSLLTRYGLEGEDAIDATRAVRAALHGFVTLEAAGGFGLPQDVDRSFTRLVEILDAALGNWSPGKGGGRPSG
jgi:AcrR family transcriptional regulator